MFAHACYIVMWHCDVHADKHKYSLKDHLFLEDGGRIGDALHTHIHHYCCVVSIRYANIHSVTAHIVYVLMF